MHPEHLLTVKSVTTQKTTTYIFTAVKTSHLMQKRIKINISTVVLWWCICSVATSSESLTFYPAHCSFKSQRIILTCSHEFIIIE
jgi:hypothetical protein